MRISRFSIYATPSESVTGQSQRVHHCLVGPESEPPEQNSMLFMVCDVFDVPDESPPEEILGIARKRWDERERIEASMAELFYRIMDELNFRRNRLSAEARESTSRSTDAGFDTVALGQTGMEVFHIAYVLERISLSPMYRRKTLITADGIDGAAYLHRGRIRYTDLASDVPLSTTPQPEKRAT